LDFSAIKEEEEEEKVEATVYGSVRYNCSNFTNHITGSRIFIAD
jgi:hypothetical protein